jgi:Peptidase family M23
VAFDLTFSSPISMPDASSWLGGPGVGGHAGQSDWTELYGNDFGAGVGEQVVAAFDCEILPVGWFPDLVNGSSADKKKYGLQMIVANTGEGAGRVQAYYTHINQIEQNIRPGAKLSRGAPIGKVRSNPTIPVHLHFAMRAQPGAAWAGVTIPESLKAWAKAPSQEHVIRFQDDGKVVPDAPPKVDPFPRVAPLSSELEGYDPDAEWLSRRVLALQRMIGNRATAAALRPDARVALAASALRARPMAADAQSEAADRPKAAEQQR